MSMTSSDQLKFSGNNVLQIKQCAVDLVDGNIHHTLACSQTVSLAVNNYVNHKKKRWLEYGTRIALFMYCTTAPALSPCKKLTAPLLRQAQNIHLCLNLNTNTDFTNTRFV